MERSLELFLAIFVPAFVTVLVCLAAVIWAVVHLKRTKEKRRRLLELSLISRMQDDNVFREKTPSELNRYIDEVTPRDAHINGPLVIGVNDLPRAVPETVPKTSEQTFYSSMDRKATSTPRIPAAVTRHDATTVTSGTAARQSLPRRTGSPVGTDSDSGSVSTEPIIRTEVVDHPGARPPIHVAAGYSSRGLKTDFQGAILIHVDNTHLPAAGRR